jgi:hypothetical protein
MNPPTEITETLRHSLQIYRDLLEVVQNEGHDLRAGRSQPLAGQFAAKKDLLPRLSGTLDQLTKTRASWQATDPALRLRQTEVSTLVRQNQDLLMKIIVIDRENEQALLRQGLLPTRDLPSVNRQRPHFVTEMYRRQSSR